MSALLCASTRFPKNLNHSNFKLQIIREFLNFISVDYCARAGRVIRLRKLRLLTLGKADRDIKCLMYIWSSNNATKLELRLNTVSYEANTPQLHLPVFHDVTLSA